MAHQESSPPCSDDRVGELRAACQCCASLVSQMRVGALTADHALARWTDFLTETNERNLSPTKSGPYGAVIADLSHILDDVRAMTTAQVSSHVNTTSPVQQDQNSLNTSANNFSAAPQPQREGMMGFSPIMRPASSTGGGGRLHLLRGLHSANQLQSQPSGLGLQHQSSIHTTGHHVSLDVGSPRSASPVMSCFVPVPPTQGGGPVVTWEGGEAAHHHPSSQRRAWTLSGVPTVHTAASPLPPNVDGTMDDGDDGSPIVRRQRVCDPSGFLPGATPVPVALPGGLEPTECVGFKLE